jgi:thiol-disulfide isomerase/thioredoxin
VRVALFAGAVIVVVACGGSETHVATVTVPAPSVLPTVTAEPAPPPMPTYGEVGPAAPEVLAPSKVTLVHFFASWCMPCTKSLPQLDAVYRRHAGRVAVIAVGEDDDEADMRSFVSQIGVVYTVLWDSAKAKASRWRVNTMPVTYVVDKHGALRFTHAGYREGDAETLEKEAATLLAEM